MKRVEPRLLPPLGLLLVVLLASVHARPARSGPGGAWRPLPVPEGAWRPAKPGRPLGELVRSYEHWRDGQGLVATPRAHQRRLLEIGAVGSPEAFAYLDGLARRSRYVAEQAAAIQAMGNAAFAAYEGKVARRAKSSREPEIRAAALFALHRMGATERVSVYETVLSREHDAMVLAAATKGLAWAGSRSAREALLDAFVHPRTAEVQRHAYVALTRFTPHPPSKALVLMAGRSASLRLRSLAIQDAYFLGLENATALALASAADARKDADLRATVFDALVGVDEGPAVAALLGLVPRLDAVRKARLLDHLRAVRSPSAVRAMGRALDEQDTAVRRVVARGLAAVPNTAAAEAIVRRLSRETDEATLHALLDAVGGEPYVGRGRPVVVLAKKARRPEIREAALEAMGRIGLGDASVRAECARRLSDSDPAVRIATIETVASTGSPQAAGILLLALEDDDPVVRETAVVAFRRVRVAEAVPGLIDLLETEEDEVVREALEETLYRITGLNLYDVVSRWRTWWEENKTAFRVPEKVPPRPVKLDRGHTVATFYGLPVSSRRVVFVLDKSGSMMALQDESRRRAHPSLPSKLDRAVSETMTVVNRLGDRARADVILFDDAVRPWRGRLTTLSARARHALGEFLDRQTPAGGTNLFDALEEALRTPGVKSVYILSDGLPTSGKFTRQGDIMREIEKVNRSRRVRIHAVSLGHDSVLLRRLAKAHRGTYVRR